MSKVILRTAKLKTFGNIGGSLKHNYREIDTPNADPNKTKDNWHSLSNSNEVMEKIKSRLPEKRRADAVLCIEYLITASPEWEGFKDGRENEYFEKSIEWLKKRHGEENVIATSIHRDETTPHLVAYVVPIDEKGKLNCKHFLGGRKKLSDMQTDFADTMEGLNLERGVRKSKAEHTTIKQYYTAINKPLRANGKEIRTRIPEVQVERKLFESDKKYCNRVQEEIRKSFRPIAISLDKQNDNLKIENSMLKEKIENINKNIDGIVNAKWKEIHSDYDKAIEKEKEIARDETRIEMEKMFEKRMEDILKFQNHFEAAAEINKNMQSWAEDQRVKNLEKNIEVLEERNRGLEEKNRGLSKENEKNKELLQIAEPYFRELSEIKRVCDGNAMLENRVVRSFVETLPEYRELLYDETVQEIQQEYAKEEEARRAREREREEQAENERIEREREREREEQARLARRAEQERIEQERAEQARLARQDRDNDSGPSFGR